MEFVFLVFFFSQETWGNGGGGNGKGDDDFFVGKLWVSILCVLMSSMFVVGHWNGVIWS